MTGKETPSKCTQGKKQSSRDLFKIHKSKYSGFLVLDWQIKMFIYGFKIFREKNNFGFQTVQILEVPGFASTQTIIKHTYTQGM